MTNLTGKCVAEFQRLAIDSKGGDRKARIYEADNGFVVSFYDGKEYVGASVASCEYGSALKVAIDWLDNSEFFS
jgi:hypothetical protein